MDVLARAGVVERGLKSVGGTLVALLDSTRRAECGRIRIHNISNVDEATAAARRRHRKG